MQLLYQESNAIVIVGMLLIFEFWALLEIFGYIGETSGYFEPQIPNQRSRPSLRCKLPQPASCTVCLTSFTVLATPSYTMSGSSSTTSKTASSTFPDGASCWLCLEEGPDDSGAPLVRDCSCRGHSGFAHLPCLVQFAESKSRDFIEKKKRSANDDIFSEKLFTQCPNCKQSFQGDVYYDLTKAQLSFVEKNFKVPSWHLLALKNRMDVIDGGKEADRIEGEEICDKMLTMIEDDMVSSKPSVDIGSIAMAYQSIGRFHFHVGNGNDESLKTAKYYYEKARDAYSASGDGWAHEASNLLLAKIDARLNGNNLQKTTAVDLDNMRAGYKRMSQRRGEHAIETIKNDVRLARQLIATHHTIEALRLLDKLVVTSRRVHGASHTQTKIAESLWQQMKLRFVSIGKKPHLALRYEQDGNSGAYVVNGPVPMNFIEECSKFEYRKFDLDEEKTFSVPGADIFFLGTPVALHGLKKHAHLNGQIGDIREYCMPSNRYTVHLEGKASKPVKVKHENLRILFDLPDPKPKKESP